MLSRSNSNAGDRIRRAKSTSSTHTASSGPRPVYPSSDPFVTRQQAETAALEAFYRAQQTQAPALPDYRPVPPKLERRRSRASGRTEGGHFGEARLGRRKSASKRDSDAAAKPIQTRCSRQSEITNDASNEEKVIIRKRSVIPPNSSTTYNYSLPSSSSRHVRKSQSGYTDGSPLPRHTSALKERRSTLQLSTPGIERREPGRDDSSRQSYGFGQECVPAVGIRVPRDSIPSSQTASEDIALARDKYLQDFQQKKLRERKSFILGPFQKRKSSNVLQSSSSGYDTSLPPFNYADDSLLPPPPPPLPEIPVPTSTIQNEKKSRNFSESLKGRFKKVFRRTSRVPTELPAQHVEGKHFTFSASSPLSTPDIKGEKQEDPFTSFADTYLPVPDQHTDSASGRYSAAAQSTAKSRVTSWTNSSAAGTWSTRPDDQSADEHGRLTRSDSVSTLRKATSFFGRPIKNKLRKASKVELRSTEESAGLYNALQEHINSPKTVTPTAIEKHSADSRTPSALATLPSQQRVESSSVRSKSQRPAPTIRSVTPDALPTKSDPLSPVTEVLSPELAQRYGSGQAKTDEEQSNPTPRSQLQRRPAVKAPTPSKEQVARRIERSKNRWQSPLDELSPPAPRASRAAMEDNPYELRSLSRTLEQSTADSDLPHHAKVSEQSPQARDNVLSPSVYSRGTDGATPTPNTPSEPDQSCTMVTITGREVRSYSISPKKPDPPVARSSRHSQEWRRWLSDELSGWNSIAAVQELALPETILPDAKASDVDVTTPTQHSSLENSNDSMASSSSAQEGTPLEPKVRRRNAQSRRPSSHMNDRYPMLDTGRDSSTKTIKHTSRISSRAGSIPGSLMLGSEKSVAPSDGNTGEASRPCSVVTTGRVVSKHQSIATLTSNARDSAMSATAGRENDAADSKNANAGVGLSNSGEIAQREPDAAPRTSKRTKSAFELRAKYKTNANGMTKPIAVHRKSESNQNILILEDTTIQNISAGPYASPAAMTTAPDANKENTPPSETNGLPALSSSEWLAAGASKKRDARKASAVHPAYRNRSTSKYSPSRTVTPGSPGANGDNSPGQRLVTNWLDGKRSKENTPAFV